MKNKKPYRKKTNTEKQMDSDALLQALNKNKNAIVSALDTLVETNDLWLSDVRALQSIRDELQRSKEENVLLGEWDDLDWNERHNTTGPIHYKGMV